MVAERKIDNQLLERIAQIYTWLEAEILGGAEQAGVCKACGKCCDFNSFGHSLFVTSPELMYLSAMLGGIQLKPMTGSRCPYNVNGRCSVYQYRFAGCRIFCCNGDREFQSRLSEMFLEKIKSVGADFAIPYRYQELSVALSRFAGANTCLSAGGYRPGGRTG